MKRRSADPAIAAEYGRRLCARIDALGWNQSEFARRVTAMLPKPAVGQVQGHTFGRDRVSNYCRGKYLPRVLFRKLIAKALKCKPADLLPEENDASLLVRDDSPASIFEMLPDDRCCIRLNRVVSQRTAVAIMTLLSDEQIVV